MVLCGVPSFHSIWLSEHLSLLYQYSKMKSPWLSSFLMAEQGAGLAGTLCQTLHTPHFTDRRKKFHRRNSQRNVGTDDGVGDRQIGPAQTRSPIQTEATSRRAAPLPDRSSSVPRLATVPDRSSSVEFLASPRLATVSDGAAPQIYTVFCQIRQLGYFARRDSEQTE
ncbi:hypothetical protein CMV_025598, partial [Castanea mollissima]